MHRLPHGACSDRIHGTFAVHPDDAPPLVAAGFLPVATDQTQ